MMVTKTHTVTKYFVIHRDAFGNTEALFIFDSERKAQEQADKLMEKLPGYYYVEPVQVQR